VRYLITLRFSVLGLWNLVFREHAWTAVLWFSSSHRIRLFLFLFQDLPFFPKRTKWHWLRPVLTFYNLMFTLRWLIQQCLSAQHMWLPVTSFENPLEVALAYVTVPWEHVQNEVHALFLPRPSGFWAKEIILLFLLTPFFEELFSFLPFWAYGFICGWPRPVSSRSAKQLGWRPLVLPQGVW